MLKSIIIFAIVGLMVFQTGCGDKENVDSTRPTIEIQSPENGDEFEPGDEIELRAVFRDNVELNTYYIEIHYNDDGHGHRVKDTEVPFEYEMAGEFERGLREHTVTLNIPIPIDAAHGEYHLGVQCTDIAGNEIEVFLEIFIEDDH